MIRDLIRAIREERLGLSYLGLLAFCVAATSYKIPADIPMAIAAVGLATAILFGGWTLRVGGRAGVALLLYSACIVASVPFSIWLGKSFETMLDSMKLLAMFIVAVNVLTSRRRVLWLIIIMLVLAAFFPARGAINNYLAGYVKAIGRANWRGVYGNANALSLAMTMCLPFAIGLMSLRRATAWRIVWGGLAVLFVWVVILTQSRAGFLTLGLEGLVGLALTRRRAALAGALFVGAVAVMSLTSGGFKARMDSIFSPGDHRDYSAESRLIIWKTAIGVALSRPLNGVGVGTSEMATAENAPESLGTMGGQRWKDTHNSFLNIWSEIGTPGLVAFLAFLVILLRRSRRACRFLKHDDEAYILLRAGMVSVAAFMLMGFFNTFINVWFVYVIPAAMLGLIGLAPEGSEQPVRVAGWRSARPAVLHPVSLAAERGTLRHD